MRWNAWMAATVGVAWAFEASSDCPTDASAFGALVDAAEADPTSSARSEVEVALNCLQTVPDRPDLARAYVVVASNLYERSENASVAATFLCSAESADRDVPVLPSLIPSDDDHPVQRAHAVGCAFRSTPVQTSVETWVDGRQLGVVPGLPAVQPYLIQYQQDDGTWHTELVMRDGFPDLPAEAQKRRERWVTPAIGVAFLAVAGFGAWYGLSINGRNDGDEDW